MISYHNGKVVYVYVSTDCWETSTQAPPGYFSFYRPHPENPMCGSCAKGKFYYYIYFYLKASLFIPSNEPEVLIYRSNLFRDLEKLLVFISALI